MMKVKKILSAFLAAVMVCSLLCTPAAAVTAGNAVDTLTEGRLWLDLADWHEESEVPVQVRQYDGSGDWSLGEFVIQTLNYVPLGVTFTGGPDLSRDCLVAYTDTDGDGVYECWMNDGGDPVLLSEEDTQLLDGRPWANYLMWGVGKNKLSLSADTDGYRTLTSDYLVDLFGPNTIVGFIGSDGGYYFLLTGETQDEGLASDTVERYGVTVTGQGYLTSTWASEVVDEAHASGLIPALVKADHRSYFKGEVTRAEFAAIAVHLYEALGGETAAYTDDAPFLDVPSDSDAYAYIMTARDLGIVQGTSTTERVFSPDTLVTRQDAAVMLSRVYEKLGGTLPAADGTAFPDNDQIQSYAIAAVAFMGEQGIIDGMDDGSFAPKDNATVEQALKIALEMLGWLEESSAAAEQETAPEMLDNQGG